MLEVTRVSKSFGPLQALSDVDLRVPDQTIAGLIGPNGSGKSTLLHAIVGRIGVDTGRMVLDGVDISALPVLKRVAAGVSIKFQLPRVYRELSARDNLMLASQRSEGLLGLALSRSRRRLDERVEQTLQRFALDERAGRLAGELSHGQQQWLEIAMAMAIEPRLLLLDEPTGGMSPEERERTGHIIRELSATCAVLIVEHDLDWIRRLCGQITVLHQGRVVRTDTPQAIEQDERVREIYRARV